MNRPLQVIARRRWAIALTAGLAGSPAAYAAVRLWLDGEPTSIVVATLVAGVILAGYAAVALVDRRREAVSG